MGWHETEGGLCVPDEGLWTPGDCPDSFDERLDGAGVVEGDVGQFVPHDLPLDRVGSPGCADRMGWSPLDELPAGAIVLDVNDADIAAAMGGIVTPGVGPALTITGAPVTGRPTPWVDCAGRPVLMSRFPTGTYLASAPGVLDPTDPQHVYAVALYRAPPGITSGLFGTRGAGGAGTGRGWLMRTSSYAQYGQVEGDTYRVSISGIEVRCQWAIGSLFVVRGGNITQGLNGAIVDTDPAPAGSLAGGAAFQVGAAAGVYSSGLGLVRLVVVHSATIDTIITTAWRARLAALVMGTSARMGADPSYVRASPRTLYVAGRVHHVSQGMPPIEGDTGLGADAAIVSVTSKNHSFVTGDGTTYLADRDAGLTITANPVDDTTNLAAVAPDCTGLVLAAQNPTGGPLVLRLGNAIGGAPVTSWASIRCRIYAGAGTPRLGWSTAGGAFTAISNVAAAYARTSGTALPAAATDKQAIEIPAGASVYLVLWCAGQGSIVPDEVLSVDAAGASATVVMGTLTTTEDPADGQGSVEMSITPRGWSGAGAGTPGFLYLTGGGGAVVYVTGGTWRAAIDGTTVLDSGIAPADGVEHHIRLRWVTGVGMSMEVRLSSTMALLARVNAAYDGSLQAAGTWQALSNGGGAKVRGLRSYRNGGG